MGQVLVDWADSRPRKTRSNSRGLTRTERIVYRAMCQVTAEDRCIFYMHPDDLLERIPDIDTTSALRNHISGLHHKGYIGHVSLNERRPQRGGGESNRYVYHPDGSRLGLRSVTHWLILADGITPEFPRQGRLPLLTLYRTTPKSAIRDEWNRAHASELASDFLPKAVGETPGFRTQAQPDKARSVRKSDKTPGGHLQEVSENWARLMPLEATSVRKADTTPSDDHSEPSEKRTQPQPIKARSVRKSDKTSRIGAREVSENLTRPRGVVSDFRTSPRGIGGYKNGIHESMHASMLEGWTELLIAQCARRSGLVGLRPRHLQESPRGRNGPIASVYESVNAYIEREDRAPPDETAGWLADELHYTLLYDENWQDGGHNSAKRLVAFIATVVSHHLARNGSDDLYFDPKKGAPETTGHRYQRGRPENLTEPINRSL